MARYGGGVVSLTVYSTILANVQSKSMKQLVPQAAVAAGLPESSTSDLLGAITLGSEALAKVPGITDNIISAAVAAYQQSYIVGLR